MSLFKKKEKDEVLFELKITESQLKHLDKNYEVGRFLSSMVDAVEVVFDLYEVPKE